MDCAYSQLHYVVSLESHPEMNGVYQFVDDPGFESSLKLECGLFLSHMDPEIKECYKHTLDDYYLVFWNWWLEISQNVWEEENEWMLIGRGKKWPIMHGEMNEYLARGILIQVGDVGVDLLKFIETMSERKTTIIRQQQTHENSSKIIVNAQNASLVDKEIFIYNLTTKPKNNKRKMESLSKQVGIMKLRQNELESQRTTGIIIISVLGFACLVSLTVSIYCCMSTKSEKNRVSQLGFDEMNSEVQNRREIVIKRSRIKSKWVRDPTAMGRFDAERFSDAISNLPVVQDVVLDGIMDEMETEEGKNNESNTLVNY